MDAPLSDDQNLTISGNGRLELEGDNKDFTGTSDTTQGELKINADFSKYTVIIQSQALVSGASTLGSVNHHLIVLTYCWIRVIIKLVLQIIKF
ncbi:MAG: hypothetical protein C0440_05845 [Candidatus Pelagibacter sp.]|nr:hypothetical protein [Candidatus Pelagibacter sp.]